MIPAGQRSNERILAISDGLFAVALTLLFVAISVPKLPLGASDAAVAAAVLALSPSFEMFVISFVVVAFYWHSHHDLFFYITGHDGVLSWLNFVFLLFITLLPFSTALIGRYSLSRTAVDFYSCCMLACSLVLVLLWLYASWGRRFTRPQLDAHSIRQITLLLLYPAGIFLLSLLLSAVNLRLAKYSWLLIVFRFHLHRRFTRRISALWRSD